MGMGSKLSGQDIKVPPHETQKLAAATCVGYRWSRKAREITALAGGLVLVTQSP